jgi:hypothetical protein
LNALSNFILIAGIVGDESTCPSAFRTSVKSTSCFDAAFGSSAKAQQQMSTESPNAIPNFMG